MMIRDAKLHPRRHPTDLPTTVTDLPAALIAANRAAVYGTVSRWLLHDLRNPTQALSLLAELVSDPSAEPDPDLYTTLRDATQQLAACVDLLDRALRPARPSTEVHPVALPELLTYLARLHRVRRSTVRLDIAPALAAAIPAVSAVEEDLEHALLNLLMNAVDALHEREEGLVSVTATADADQVELRVDDNGPGIAPEIRDRLFEPYVTAHHSKRGAGTGLAVARYLVERCRGTLTYQPKPEPGARFVVTLKPWPRKG